MTFYPELQAAAKRVLASRGWSLRQAEIKTGIGYSVIHRMATGCRVSPETLISWAGAIGEESSMWLKAAGFSVLDADLTSEIVDAPEADRALIREDQRGRVARDDDEQYLLAYWRGEAPDVSPAARAMLEGLIRAHRDSAGGRTIGKRADDGELD